MTYRPLPDFLVIRQSSVDGHGLFTTKSLLAGTELGITHIKDSRFEDGYIRTPLGGFFNHSESPNCEAYVSGDYIRLKVIKDIPADGELLAFYWLYDLSRDK